MNRTETRCLVSSAAIHAAAVLALLLASYWAVKYPPQFSEPIELIETGIKMDGLGAGGGNPAPPAPTPTPAPPPVARPVITEPVPFIPVPTPTPPRARVVPVPPEVRPAPPKDPPVREVLKRPPVHVSTEVLKSQLLADHVKPPVKPPKAPIKVAPLPKGPTPAEIKAQREAQRAAEAEALAEQQARERAREQAAAVAAARAWQAQVAAVGRTLKERMTGETEIFSPGLSGGGEAWVGYGTYLKAFYELRWRRPSSLPVPVAYVGVSITVARDGTLVRFEVIERSGIRVLDDSVTEVLQRHRKLDPLPAGTTDPERVFRIKFKLEGTSA